MFLQCSFCFCLLFLTSVLSQRTEDLLPKNVRPLHYTLSFEVLNFTHYHGSALIVVEALKETSSITLHSRNIYVNEKSIYVVDQHGRTIDYIDSTIDEDKDFYTINLNATLNKTEKYNLTIEEFFGIITEDKYGVFKAKYKNPNNTTMHLVLTELSPMNARTAFPCFDETALKATFVINLIRPSEIASASNMPLLKTFDLGNNRYQDVYQQTPVMSTYLVAFVFSSYEYTNNNGIIRILAPQHFVNDGSLDYILKESSEILKAFEEYTNIKYPLPKLDLVSIPNKYFVDGAMENWGLITYSDIYLHCPNTSSAPKRQVCITFSSHEFAHQWFGNLVTPKTWNYIWLSEGFGSYFQYHIGDKIKPLWRLKEQFVIEVVHNSMKNDLYDQAINHRFLSKEDFPTPQIYYEKASSIIRMISYVLTEDVFQEGLRLYLKNNLYEATEPLDLYNAFQEALDLANKQHLLGNLTIHEILETWTTNLALPIVTATRNYESGTVTFSQKNPIDYDNDANTFWHIPITYVFSKDKEYNFNKTTSDFWLSRANGTVSGYTEGWLLVNKQASGYYQVNYDETNWKRIIDFLHSDDFTVIPPLNRAQLINDAFYFVQQEALKPDLLFNLTMYLKRENDYIPVLSFLKNVMDIQLNLKKVEDRKIFKMYIEQTLKGSFIKLGIENSDRDTHVDRLHRKEILLICATIENCKRYVLDRLKNWMTTGIPTFNERLHPSLLCGAISLATIEEWEFLLNEYFACKRMDFKKAYLTSLSCTRDPIIINKFLDVIFNENNSMSEKDRSDSFNRVGSESEIGKKAVIDYLLNLEDDGRFQDLFGSDADMYIEMSLPELDTYVPVLRRKIKSIPLAFLNGDNVGTDLAEEFLTWTSKYLANNDI